MTKPPTYPLIYHDHLNLYLEFPGRSPPLVMKFIFTEGGLQRALRHIPNIAPKAGHSPSLSRVAPKIAKATAKRREIRNFSADQRAEAQELIRKLGTGD
jgi:hypothetical protein